MSQFSLGSGAMEFGGDDAPLQRVAARVVQTMTTTAKAMERAAQARFTAGGDDGVIRQAQALREKLEQILGNIPVKAGPVEAPPDRPFIGTASSRGTQPIPDLGGAVQLSRDFSRNLLLASKAMIAIETTVSAVDTILGATDLISAALKDDWDGVAAAARKMEAGIKELPIVGDAIIRIGARINNWFTGTADAVDKIKKDTEALDKITAKLAKRAEEVAKLRNESAALFQRTIAELARQGKTPEEVALLNVRQEIEALEKRAADARVKNPREPEPKETAQARIALRQKEGLAEITEARARQRRIDDLAVEGAELRARLAGRTREAERIALERQLDKEIEDTKDFAQARQKQLEKPAKLQLFDEDTARQEAETARRNAEVIDQSRRELLQGEERRAAEFEATLQKESDDLRKAGDTEADILAFQNQRRQKFFDEQKQQRDDLIHDLEREALPEPQRRQADFEAKVERDVKRLRDAGVDEGKILELIGKERDKFQTDEANRNKPADFQAQIVPLEDAFRRIQAAAASGTDAASRIAKTAQAAQSAAPTAAAQASRRESEISAQATDFAKTSAEAGEEAVTLLEKINANTEAMAKKPAPTAIVA